LKPSRVGPAGSALNVPGAVGGSVGMSVSRLDFRHFVLRSER